MGIDDLARDILGNGLEVSVRAPESFLESAQSVKLVVLVIGFLE